MVEGAALGDRGRIRDRHDRTRAGAQREPLMARLAPLHQLRDADTFGAGWQTAALEKGRSAPNSRLPPSIQEIRRVAMRLAQRCIEAALVPAWSAQQRAYPATAHWRTSAGEYNRNAATYSALRQSSAAARRRTSAKLQENFSQKVLIELLLSPDCARSVRRRSR